jgi:hypothetical protein
MSATTTNLKTQVQAKITGATSALSLEELFILRKSADGLDCNESNLDTLVTAKLNAMGSSTPIEDLLFGNRAADIPESSTSQIVIRKIQEITVSGNWTVPANIAGGTLWVTGCGGGGSGVRVNSTTIIANGGFGGSYGINIPISVSPLQVIPVIIGAGGAGIPASGTVSGNSGGTTSFGSLSFRGGSGGQVGLTDVLLLGCSGVNPPIVLISPARAILAQSLNGNECGASSITSISNISCGGAAGLFGNGTAGKLSTGTQTDNAPANSGAGSGGSGGSTDSVGAGGSGKILVEWEEFV